MKRSQNSSFTFLSHKSLIFIPESRKKDTWKYLIIVRFIQHALCLFMQACKRHFSCIRILREMKKRRTRLRCLLPLHKPCSVLRKEWQSFIYVTTRSDHWLRFAVIRFPYQIWVSRLRGLPVPSFRFPEKLVSVALLKESAIAFTTGLLQPSAYAAWIYRFIQHKHYIRHRM